MTEQQNPPAADRLAQTVTDAEVARASEIHRTTFFADNGPAFGAHRVAMRAALEAFLRARESAPAQEPVAWRVARFPSDEFGDKGIWNDYPPSFPKHIDLLLDEGCEIEYAYPHPKASAMPESEQADDRIRCPHGYRKPNEVCWNCENITAAGPGAGT